MGAQPLLINVPDELYQQLEELAVQSQRSVEAETLELLTQAIPHEDRLPDDHEQLVASMTLLTVDELLAAAKSRLSADESDELEQLHFKQQREGLTAAEQLRNDELLRLSDQFTLVRAKALSLLAEQRVFA